MLRFSILLICLTTVLARNFYAKDVLDSHIEFAAVKNLTEFLRENPQIKLLDELKKEPTAKAQIRYTLGKRVSGDKLIATGSARQEWASLQDVALTVTYPRTGTGAIVTYVEILVDQTSTIGRAYVREGGINQRRIVIVVEAYSTLYFQHNTQIFGY